jgi:superfamily II DNA/RNA helicase
VPRALDDGTVVKAAEGLTLLTRLRQVATGLDLLGHDVADSSKLDMALELIEDNPDEAFVVFSWFKAAAHSLAKRLTEHRIGCFVVDGDVPHEARSQMISTSRAARAVSSSARSPR